MDVKILVTMLCLLVVISGFSFTSAIDATPPEAVISYDPVVGDIVVTGTDNIDNDVNVLCLKSPLGPAFREKCSLTDNDGNRLELYMRYRMLENSIEFKVKITGMRYNGGSMIIPENNVLGVKVVNSRFIYQRLFLGEGDQPTAYGSYSELLDKTRITEADTPWNKQTIAGFAALNLITDNGEVGYNIA